MSQQEKNIYVVLGVARSGTSLLASGLNALGVDLGNHLTPGNEQWNAKGFWEDDDISYQINRQILKLLGHKRERLQLIDLGELNDKKLKKLQQSAIELLKQRFNTQLAWGFKDPRTAKILPFWQAVFQSLNLNENYLISLRNPLSSALSFQSLKGYEIEIGLLFWLMHLIPAIDNTTGKKRLVVQYENMLQNPRQQLERIKAKFKMTNVNEINITAFANDFVEKKYNRFGQNDLDLKTHAANKVVPLCGKTYDLLLKLATDEMDPDGQEFVSGWQEIKNDFEKIYPLYCYMDNLLQAKTDLEKTIAKIHKSFYWKLNYPIRKLKNILWKKELSNEAIN